MIQITFFCTCVRILIRSPIRLLGVLLDVLLYRKLKKTVRYIAFIMFIACTVMLLHYINKNWPMNLHADHCLKRNICLILIFHYTVYINFVTCKPYYIATFSYHLSLSLRFTFGIS